MSGIVKTLHTGRELPFVSVVTPTWNRAAFLPYLLYIYRRQDYPADRRELVILDDSPQSHLPIIQKLTQGHPEKFNIRYIHHPERLALGKKRNMLNELAVGEYILCMDDDDYYPADKISYTIGMMQKHRALISGSDQIPIWYSHINRIFKTHSFGKHHILNGTFCYHRNYLKKHRYDDECNMAEEIAFTNNYTANPLQLPCERTILCVSHSHNTFDKDFILGSSIPMNTTMEEWVSDPILKNWYQSLHNATHNQPLKWNAIDQIIIINLDKRQDRLTQTMRELELLKVPKEKITRLSAYEETNGHLGRRHSHLQALLMAKQNKWGNYLLLEDDTVILKQEKHIRVLNGVMDILSRLPWEVILLGGEINRGKELKSLNGVIHANDCNKICSYLVNSSYYSTLEQQMQQDPSATLEEQWQPLLREGKWLACYPSICYQRASYSDIEKKETDNIRYYFNKINKSSIDVNRKNDANVVEINSLSETIGFYMETAFHYQIYKPIIDELQSKGLRCGLLVNDRAPKGLRDEMLTLIKKISNPQLGGQLITNIVQQNQRYRCLVSPYYVPEIAGCADIHIRAMHGLADEEWNHAWWNIFYHYILCFGSYSQQALNINGNAVAVGNPRFDEWHMSNENSVQRTSEKKPVVLYIPSFGSTSSLPFWAEKLSRLSRDYQFVVLAQHFKIYGSEAEKNMALAKRNFTKFIDDSAISITAIRNADYVITDNSESMFDAIHAEKHTILLNSKAMPASLTQQISKFSCLDSLPIADDIKQLKTFLSPNHHWSSGQSILDNIRKNYCDIGLDGLAAQRSAQMIITAYQMPINGDKNTTLASSLRYKLFS